MSSKGQLTVPAAVRDHFDLKTGDVVDVTYTFDERPPPVQHLN
jgi:AbrB family looped-hinge helix DNA binding protein